ncbi:MAG TPA: porin family protein [Bacteroidales bacterium]|nr:porin family protein [Bacteroidales bacterium]
MKIYVVTFLVFVFAVGLVYGQETRVGMLAGINFQNLNGEDGSGDKLENNLIIGFHAGANILMPISPEIYFQPGLLFSTKGAANDDTQDIKYKLNYVELPLNLVYRGQLRESYVLLGFGPYAAMAVNGKVDFDNVSRDIEFTNKVESGDPLTTPYMKRFDAGANIFAGYEFSGGLFFQLNAQLGLLNLTPQDERLLGNESIVKNTGFGLSAGFRF